MTLLLLGLALWIAAHFFKRAAPGPRAALQARLGPASKGIFAVALVASVVLMVFGYREAAYVPVYDPPGWGVHLNNLAMIFAVGLFGLGSSKSPLKSRLQHPQLLGFTVWASAHLLVNGDRAALVLFGTLLLWALAEMALITAQDGHRTPPAGGSTAGTVRLVVITLVVYAVITVVHAWLGVWPFPG